MSLLAVTESKFKAKDVNRLCSHRRKYQSKYISQRYESRCVTFLYRKNALSEMLIK